MKKLILIGAAIVALHASLDAQTLNITAPGFSGTKLFDSTAGFTITGLAADAGGDVYYLETDSAFAANTRLYKRTAASGYAAPAAPLYDLGSPVFGSFVTVGGGKVFFGESSANTIYAINPDGSAADVLGTVPNNFDASFYGASLFISHNIETNFLNPPKNRVSKFDLLVSGSNLALGPADMIVDAVNDYSGPVEIDAGGALFYGASGANGIVGLYRFGADEVAGAFGPATLGLDAAHRLVAGSSNAYLAAGDGSTLWQDDYTTLSGIDTTTGASTPIGATPNSLGQLDFANGELFASVTKFSTNRSSVYAVVPEPAAASLLAAGIGIGALRRRRA